jgi:tyrosyl-tRNA synthetase
VAVQSDIELGGTDQTFNLNVGRTIQKHANLPPQVCVINTLLEGIDGSAKMSKSLGNAIGLDTLPKEMFGLATRVPDALVGKYLRLATDVADPEIDRLIRGDIWSAKKAMAEALVARHYGTEAGRREREEFERVFRDRELPEEIPEHPIDLDAAWTATSLVREAFQVSGAEARRLVEQGAVTLDDARLKEPLAPLKVRGGQVLRAGKRRFAKLVARRA